MVGWLGLAVYVALWDRFANKTLSRALWDGLEDPRSRAVVIGLWAWLTSHLFLKKPKKILWFW